MKCDTLALIERKILMRRGSAHKIGMIAGIAPENHWSLVPKSQNKNKKILSGRDFVRWSLKKIVFLHHGNK
jgi:hypothetical protein